MNTQYSLGIDIGGTNTVAGIVSRNGEIISKTSLPTRGHASFEVFLDALKTATDKMLAQHSNLEISG
ncbi:MAG: ROK family protein, partial [Bacteroidetes bacterium]|nr:ROK family protein [Bacteroidota bacterium]